MAASLRNDSDPINYSFAAVIGTWNLQKREDGREMYSLVFDINCFKPNYWVLKRNKKSNIAL